jgi:hypothetical protein
MGKVRGAVRAGDCSPSVRGASNADVLAMV